MPKPAIIELDSAIAHMRFTVAELLESYYVNPPKIHISKFQAATAILFEAALASSLSWMSGSYDQEMVMRVLHALGLVSSPDADEPPFMSEFDTDLCEYVYERLISQIEKVVGSDRHFAWHSSPAGTSRVLIPGGLMIDLDRLKDQSGIVEVDLDAHWRGMSSQVSVKNLEVSEDVEAVSAYIVKQCQKDPGTLPRPLQLGERRKPRRRK